MLTDACVSARGGALSGRLSRDKARDGDACGDAGVLVGDDAGREELLLPAVRLAGELRGRRRLDARAAREFGLAESGRDEDRSRALLLPSGALIGLSGYFGGSSP
jgi:hypothetical protein